MKLIPVANIGNTEEEHWEDTNVTVNSYIFFLLCLHLSCNKKTVESLGRRNGEELERKYLSTVVKQKGIIPFLNNGVVMKRDILRPSQHISLRNELGLKYNFERLYKIYTN